MVFRAKWQEKRREKINKQDFPQILWIQEPILPDPPQRKDFPWHFRNLGPGMAAASGEEQGQEERRGEHPGNPPLPTGPLASSLRVTPVPPRAVLRRTAFRTKPRARRENQSAPGCAGPSSGSDSRPSPPAAAAFPGPEVTRLHHWALSRGCHQQGWGRGRGYSWPWPRPTSVAPE